MNDRRHTTNNEAEERLANKVHFSFYLKRTAIGAAILIVGIAFVFWGKAPASPSFEQVKKNFHPSDVWIVDQQDQPMESIRTRTDHRSLGWVPLSEVSPAFIDLLVHSEDRHFYSHSGVDVPALAKGFWNALSGGPRRGASTLSMQLAKILNPSLRRSWNPVVAKISQILASLKLESKWKKEEILEAYFNMASFRGELVGLRAASLGEFKKNPVALTREESAFLVVLLRAPNANSERIAERACRLLQESNCENLRLQAHEIFEKSYDLARARDLVPVLSEKIVEDRRDPSVIRTSLDRRLQELSVMALREQLKTLRSQNVHDGAIVILESQTGRVVSYVANAGNGFASSDQIDGIQARRQAGSTLKPFVYGTALEKNLIHPGSLIEDSKEEISVGPGMVYHPRNYDNRFHGLVKVGEALGSSLNVPAVRMLGLATEASVLENMQSLGFEELQDVGYYGPSLGLGTVDVTLWELTQGYRQLAVDNPVFSEQTRKDLFAMLSSAENRRLTFGLQSLLTLPFPAAVKTGTSKDMRDNWCLGWTSQYTVGVWVGNFNGEPMWNVSGMSGAAPIWRQLMLALHPNPQGETAPMVESSEPLEKRSLTRIRYPAAQMLVGLDPDIPSRLQKLPIEIESPQKNHRVFINGKNWGPAQENLFWPLQKGSQRIELKNARGETIDEVRFIVR